MNLPSGTTVWGLVACIALTGHIAASWLDLRDFKTHIEAQSQALSERVSLQEAALNDALQYSAAAAADQVAQIDALYHDAVDAVNRMQLELAAGDSEQPVPDPATPASGAGDPQKPKSPPKDKAMAQKLLKCEAQVLFEAREHDICATHYNTVISIYDNARRTVGNDKSDKNTQ